MSEEKKNKPFSGTVVKKDIGNGHRCPQSTGINDNDGSDDIIRFDSGGKMPPGKVVTESTKGDVRKHIKK
jgi:hypothetical protein